MSGPTGGKEWLHADRVSPGNHAPSSRKGGSKRAPKHGSYSRMGQFFIGLKPKHGMSIAFAVFKRFLGLDFRILECV